MSEKQITVVSKTNFDTAMQEENTKIESLKEEIATCLYIDTEGYICLKEE